MVLRQVCRYAEFSPERMGKAALGSGTHLYAGLNCFLPGQQHAAHVHPDQDKLYFILAGSGEAMVGDETHAVSEGDLVLAAAGVPHGLRNTGQAPMIALVVFAPPPRKS
ncbi:MAG: cupin domain-containing protein [Bryobacteraceae bacterium]|nr:cupin domain-containing protein [Bryobacteraceae bacterium]